MRNTSLTRSIEDLRDDAKGGVAMLLGLTIIPIMLAAGLASDYAIGQSVKTRLDSAADAAALAAIKATQTAITELSPGNPNLTNLAVAAGQTQGGLSFSAQAGRRYASLLAPPTISISISGQTITANVSYRAAAPTSFGKIAGIRTMNMNNAVSASLTMAKYLDFYLLLDVSGSMGLPSTAAGQQQLAPINKDNDFARYPQGCAFACHFPGSQSYGIARANNIQLRIDAVGGAVASLMDFAQKSATLPNQFRVGVYPFINHANAFVDLTSDLTADQYSVATAINYNAATGSTNFGKLLDSGEDAKFASSYNPNYKANPRIPADTTTIGAGGTHFSPIFDEMLAKVKSVGAGNGANAATPRPFVFLVSDGMEDSQSYVTKTAQWPGVTPYPTPFGQTVSIRAMDPAACAALKKVATVAVLYIPYAPIVNPTDFANSEDFKVNDAVPNLAANMSACATPGFFWSATTPAEITTAMQTMFAQSLQSARLTQ